MRTEDPPVTHGKLQPSLQQNTESITPTCKLSASTRNYDSDTSHQSECSRESITHLHINRATLKSKPVKYADGYIEFGASKNSNKMKCTICLRLVRVEVMMPDKLKHYLITKHMEYQCASQKDFGIIFLPVRRLFLA